MFQIYDNKITQPLTGRAATLEDVGIDGDFAILKGSVGSISPTGLQTATAQEDEVMPVLTTRPTYVRVNIVAKTIDIEFTADVVFSNKLKTIKFTNTALGLNDTEVVKNIISVNIISISGDSKGKVTFKPTDRFVCVYDVRSKAMFISWPNVDDISYRGNGLRLFFTHTSINS